MAKKIFDEELKVLNIGLESFYLALKDQGVKALHVEWRPPVKLEKEIEDILGKIL